MAKNKEQKEQEAKDRSEAQRIQQERAQGAANLAQHNAEQEAKSDKDIAKDDALAKQQQEEAAAAERERAEAEQAKAAEALRVAAEERAAEEIEAKRADAEARGMQDQDPSVDEDLGPSLQERAVAMFGPDIFVAAPGTVLHMNGLPVELAHDAVLKGAMFSNEQHLAAVLAMDPVNFGLNADRLRVVYSPMNGTLLPLGDQRLKLEEMTDAEAALFTAPAQRPKK